MVDLRDHPPECLLNNRKLGLPPDTCITGILVPDIARGKSSTHLHRYQHNLELVL